MFLVALLAAAFAQDSQCADPGAPIIADLDRVLTRTAQPGHAAQDYTHLSDAVLQAQVTSLNTRAQRLAPYVDAYAELMDQVAGHNVALLQSWAVAAELAYPLSGPSPADGALLRAVVEESTRQLRQDLRTGQVSALLSADVLAVGGTPESAVAAMRLDQLLQKSDLPQDFWGHSPSSLDDIYGPEPLPNAPGVAETLDALLREANALNEALNARELPAAVTPTLTASAVRLQELDVLVTEIGAELYDSLNGLRGYSEVWQVAPVAGPGGRGFERHTVVDGFYTYPASTISPDPRQLSEADLESLVRLKDSLELLENNRSGLTPADVAMSPWLRAHLGLAGAPAPEHFTVEQLGLFQDSEGRWSVRREVIDYTPSEDLSERQRAIDLAALVPVEERRGYLLSLRLMGYGRSLSERRFTQETEAHDNSWLNRTVELVDTPGWIFNGTERENWIGHRSRINLRRSRFLGGEVDALNERIVENVLSGEHALVMGQLQEVYGLNNAHSDANLRYAAQRQDTQTGTELYLATLPLSVVGWVDDGARLLGGMRRFSPDDGARIVDELAALDDATFFERATPLEDEFLRQFRRRHPNVMLDDRTVRSRFRANNRFTESGNIQRLHGEAAALQRQRDIEALRDFELRRNDIMARGLGQERYRLSQSDLPKPGMESPDAVDDYRELVEDSLEKKSLGEED